MAEAHETKWIGFILRSLNEIHDIFSFPDLIKHTNNCFICATVRPSPECDEPRSNTSKRIRLSTTCEPDRGGARILFVICVQD